MRHVKMRPDRAGHAMHQGDRAIAEGKPGKCGALHHRFPRRGVFRVLIDGAQIGADQPHGAQCIFIRFRIGAARHQGLQRMGQAINARIGGGAWRHAEGQFVIHNRGQGQRTQPRDQHLLIGFGISDHGEARGLTARAGGGRDANHRQRGLIGLGGHLEVAHLRTGGCGGQDGHGLGGIHRAAAAETNQAIIIAGLHGSDTGCDHGIGRVRHGIAEHAIADARCLERPEQFFNGAGRHHPGIGDHQRA